MTIRDDARSYQKLTATTYTTALRAVSGAPTWHPTRHNHLLLVAPSGAGATSTIDYLLAMVSAGRRGRHDIVWASASGITRSLPLAFRIPKSDLGLRVGGGLEKVEPGTKERPRIVVLDPVPTNQPEAGDMLRRLMDNPYTVLVAHVEDALLPADILARFGAVLELPDPLHPGEGWMRHGSDARPVRVPWHIPTPDIDFDSTPHLLIGGRDEAGRVNAIRHLAGQAAQRGAILLTPADGLDNLTAWGEGGVGQPIEVLEAAVHEASRLVHEKAGEVFLFAGDVTSLFHPQMVSPRQEPVARQLTNLLRKGGRLGFRVVANTPNAHTLRLWNPAASSMFSRLLMGSSTAYERSGFLSLPECAHGIPERLGHDEGIVELRGEPQWVRLPRS